VTQIYWFGVTYTYVCPICSEPNSELAVVSSTASDSKKISPAIDAQKFLCRQCHKEPPSGIQVLFHVDPGTLEQLHLAGFPVPVNPADK